MRLLTCLAFGLMLSTAVTSPALAVEPDAPETLISRLDAVGFEVQKRLAEPFHEASEYAKDERGALVEFYAEHGPVWVDETGLTAKAKAVMAEIRRADDYGLEASDYALPELTGSSPSAKDLAGAEIALSHAIIDYAHDARGGRVDPARLSGYLDPSLDLPDPSEVISKITTDADPAAYLVSFQPQHPQFEALRKKLMELRGGSAERQVNVPLDGPMLKPGENHADVALLRARLKVEETEGDRGEEFGPALAEALKDFQKSRGLAPDAIMGPATRRALNSRPKDRVKSILINMERWRWVPRDLGQYHVWLNVPEFLVRIVDDGKIAFTERTVVGKPDKQTPIFSDEMEYIDFNPFWNVPNSIKVEEILPYLVRDTGSFFGYGGVPRVIARNNLYIKYNGQPVDPNSVDWQRVDIRRFHFYQPPGGPNVLGVVKFMFPNKHDVYMHDTPTKRLFEATVRAYSHGCMRIRNPLTFAKALLSHDQGWSMNSVERAVASGNLQTVQLKTPVPVHITYFTAWASEDGEIRYFGDVYGHDGRFAAALKL